MPLKKTRSIAVRQMISIPPKVRDILIAVSEKQDKSMSELIVTAVLEKYKDFERESETGE